ncbi:uncharacterized protein [Henckelia pumila]|uniref:uncharacterized protein isoform X3 n=1 Tax=Henckelia pumila TaxID=405737 RepID=UPI003C6E452D
MYYLLRNPCPGAGACGGMCTANTMNSAIEAMGMSLPYSCCSLHHRTPLWPYFDTITAPQRAAVELVSLLGFVDGSRNGACFLRKLMLTWMQWWLLPRSFSGGSCLWNW